MLILLKQQVESLLEFSNNFSFFIFSQGNKGQALQYNKGYTILAT